MEKELLKIENISKVFKNNKKEIVALKNLSLSLIQGECLGIVGESGCGKTTLANIIIGMEKATSGEIFFHGKSIKDINKKDNKDMRKNIQMIFQTPISSFNPRMTIGEYLYEPLKNYNKIGKKKAIFLIKYILKKVNINFNYIDKYPHQLSGGELQRIAIARAMIINPEIIVCDEATSALDVSIQNQIIDLLIELKENEKFSYIFIGHDLATVQKISDRIVIMYEGEIVEILESKNLKANAKHPYTKELINSVLEI